MILDPRTLGVAFVLLSVMLGVLLLFAWAHKRTAHSLAWWGATFCLIAVGIGMANLGPGAPDYPVLLIANELTALAYGILYAGCRAFNGRRGMFLAIGVGPALWAGAFPIIYEEFSARLLLMSLIAGGYASVSAWELWRHGSHRLTSQRAAAFLLLGLAAFNLCRGGLGLFSSSIPWLNAFASRWSAEMALLLLVYSPALAFVFLSMAKERAELEHRQAERALRESEEHYRYSVELNPQIPWTANPDATILTISPRWQILTGIPIAEALGTGWAIALHPEDVARTQQRWLRAVGTGKPFDAEYRIRLVDGSYRWFRARAAARYSDAGSVFRWYGTLEDIHDRKLAEEHLRRAAYHDELTGLANRRLFQERLQQGLDQADRTGQKVGLLLIDLDDFKQVNDRFGHDAGDDLLREFGKYLVGVVPPTDTVARLGGDEFAIILFNISDAAEVAATARAIQAPMKDMLRLSKRGRECRTSIGGAISSGRDMDVDELLKRADLALYGSKTAGRGAFNMFAPALREEAQKTASALEMARNVVESDWIIPFYQPKVALHSGAVAGFEALLRWHHPRAGLQTPEMLASAFDDTELGTIIGERMLAGVLGDMRRWLDAGLNFGRIAINASSAEFRREDYADRVLERLRQRDIPPSCLEVEVTETVLINHNVESIGRTLRALCDEGVTIALDDFGTGYASLSHLKRFPVDVIKIDRSFIGDMEEDAGDAAIIKAVLGLGRNLGIKVIAEGVENANQAALLRRYGCNWGQGYHFGRPMPARDVPKFMAARAHAAGQTAAQAVTWSAGPETDI